MPNDPKCARHLRAGNAAAMPVGIAITAGEYGIKMKDLDPCVWCGLRMGQHILHNEPACSECIKAPRGERMRRRLNKPKAST